MEQTKTYKIGTTRSGSRVWLDAILRNQSNWQFGCRYDRTITSAGTITLTPNTSGRYKVSGSVNRPVIDLCGKYLTVAMDGAKLAQVSVSQTSIIITPTSN